MKVNDIKVFNPDDAEVTDKLILNTEFVMKSLDFHLSLKKETTLFLKNGMQRIQMDFSGKNKLFL